MSGLANEKEIMMIAEAVSKIVPHCCGVTLGGSRAHELNDEFSDVEMYFYSTDSIPKEEDIDCCLNKLGAQHKRCDTFLWNEYPWGPHSFFVINGLYFEIGYRIVDDIAHKIDAYLAGNVAPTTDCHDLGLGYVYSGLAASVHSEKILIAYDEEIQRIKKKAETFPDELSAALKSEYLDTAKKLLDGKLLNAADRGDVFFYDVLASRIVRSLMIMAFAVSKTHFPGDKWNESLLMRTDWEQKQKFLGLLKEHCGLSSAEKGNLLKKREILMEAYRVIEESLI